MCDFASLIIDRLGYVCYRKNEKGAEEKRILIGRSVYFLNYVSFSYDSKYLSFAAKMNTDAFRLSQEGVFEIFDLEKEEIVCRTERFHGQELWAVWMTMFNKKGDVAFYDSHANAYLVHKSNNYKEIEEILEKSLLCFSPSGRYIAFSDQNYIDYTHHPNGNWGHQPSGNVFIHAVDDINKCLEHYNDIGEDGISGVASRAGNVSAAAFSQDETKLLVVGNDGVVVVRNLKKTTLRSNKITESQLVCTNSMTASELVIKKNAPIEFHDFDDSKGVHHTFFVCGDITGYVSPNAKKAIEKGCSIDDLRYADISKDGGKPVPCLLVAEWLCYQ